MWLALALLSCIPKDVAECTEDNACEFGAVCVNGQCEGKSCSTSDQCAIENYCHGGECTPGCEVTEDCKFGDTCNPETLQCEGGGCTDTRTDCEFGEFCSPAGECYDAGGYYCRSCGSEADCGGNGNVCIWDYCGVTCVTDQDCPAGFDCYAYTVDMSGNIAGYACLTYCWLYEE